MAEGYRILVVEDDAAVRRLVTTTLDMHGYAVREAKTATQALLELSSQAPDLAILDLGLPDGDGVDVIRSLRGWSALPVIVLSARLEDADKVAALDAGADDYLVKPFSVEELLARVRVALDAVACAEHAAAYVLFLCAARRARTHSHHLSHKAHPPIPFIVRSAVPCCKNVCPAGLS